MTPGGYLWWYVDGMSDDGRFGLTMIAFIGSVFSPYYHWSGYRDPENHVAINIALYGEQGGRWAMTERRRAALSRGETHFQVGPSSLHWDGEGLRVEIDETCAPLPKPIRGRFRLIPEALNTRAFDLDSAARHRWWPIAPLSRIEVEMARPRLSWRGSGYFDSNGGGEPMQNAFVRWDWSRADLGNGEAAALYDVTARHGDDRLLALRFDRGGDGRDFEAPPRAPLPTSGWKVARGTRADPGGRPRIVETLEDAPFYARSLIETRLLGQTAPAVHESLDLDRLRTRWVWPMLPFRMPRRFV